MRKKSLETVYKLAKKNKKVIFIGSDLSPDTLAEFKKEMPERYIMEGVSEQHNVGMSAGLSLHGLRVYINTISTFFSRRALEQIILDLSLHHLPVTMIGNGGGTVYAPLGPTHVAHEDVSILLSVPNINIFIPCDPNEVEEIIHQTLKQKNPSYIRLCKGGEKNLKFKEKFKIFEPRYLKKNTKSKLIIISTGICTSIANDVYDILKKDNYEIDVLHLHSIKPINTNKIYQSVKNKDYIITMEEISETTD